MTSIFIRDTERRDTDRREEAMWPGDAEEWWQPPEARRGKTDAPPEL